MPNLKPYYDAALAADAEVKRILAEMDAAFNDGTEDGKRKALELRPALDMAQKQAEDANELYISMRDASLVNDNTAALFSTPADPAKESDRVSPDRETMSLAEYNAMSPRDRLAFAKRGGRLI